MNNEQLILFQKENVNENLSFKQNVCGAAYC